jgi:hypothetical protein
MNNVLVQDGDDKYSEQAKKCQPLVNEKGFKSVKTIAGQVELKLPHFADVRRDVERGCEYTKSITIDYLWHEGQLVPQYEYTFKVPKDEYMPVRIFYRDSWVISKKEHLNFKEPWNYEPALPHVKFPLEFYPRYHWDDPKTPSEKSIKAAELDQLWGIRNTQHKHVNSERPFHATCSIPPINTIDLNSRVEADFSKFGDSKCRGWVSAANHGKALYFMIDVWAYKGKDQLAIKAINHIYDATVEKLQSFIQKPKK